MRSGRAVYPIGMLRIAPVLSKMPVAKTGHLRGPWVRMRYVAYILQSEPFGTYYYGSAKDIERRLKRHNAGIVRSTKAKRPWKLHYQGAFQTRSEAYRRELFFKSVDGYRFLKEKGII